MKTSLVVLAAGIGSRYGGGIKQLEAVGPSGEIIIDYSIHDALEAGFDKVIFIIRQDLDEDFRRIIGDRIAKICEVDYAYQEITKLPEGFTVPEGRKKPFGTAQALLCAKDVIREPFAVINADDYYGKEAYRTLHEYLVSHEGCEDGKLSGAMVGFILKNTLSDNGGVTRGICRLGENGGLAGVDETKNIIRTPEGAAVMTDGGVVPIDPDSLVSMNMWGLYPGFLNAFEEGFPAFLADPANDPLKAEYLLPIEIDRLLREDRAKIRVLSSPDKWFGVTYQEDKASVREAFSRLIADGVYATPLM